MSKLILIFLLAIAVTSCEHFKIFYESYPEEDWLEEEAYGPMKEEIELIEIGF